MEIEGKGGWIIGGARGYVGPPLKLLGGGGWPPGPPSSYAYVVKERSCAMPLLNILIYNNIIKQTVKPAVHVQNMSGLNMLQFKVNCVLPHIKHNSRIP